MGLFKLNSSSMDVDFSYLEKCAMCGYTPSEEDDRTLSGEEVKIGQWEEYWVCGKCLSKLKSMFSY